MFLGYAHLFIRQKNPFLEARKIRPGDLPRNVASAENFPAILNNYFRPPAHYFCPQTREKMPGPAPSPASSSFAGMPRAGHPPPAASARLAALHPFQVGAVCPNRFSVAPSTQHGSFCAPCRDGARMIRSSPADEVQQQRALEAFYRV